MCRCKIYCLYLIKNPLQMKKLLYFFAFLVIGLAFGCSSDNNTNPDTLSPEAFFMKYTYDGTPVLDGVHYPTWNHLNSAIRNGDKFTVNAGAEEGFQYLDLVFNAHGNLVSVSSSNLHGVSWIYSRYNYKYVASEHFHFQLESFDETDKTVRGNFSGRLYRDNKDLNSDFVEISGSFYLPIVADSEEPDYDPNGVYSGVSAKFNGTSWHSTLQPSFSDYPYVDSGTVAPGIYVQQFISDDRYRIIIGHETVVGVRSFSNTTSGTFVRLSKFNDITGHYEDYNTTSGNIVIAEAVGVAPYTRSYKGVFSFTAVNPLNSTDVIQITDGTFLFNGHS